jgi:hypothetical protein
MSKKTELLRQALVALEGNDSFVTMKTILNIKEELAKPEPEHEAVHGVVFRDGSPTFVADRFRKDTDVLLYTSPQKREPLSDDEITKIWNQGGIPVRDTPKQVFKFTRAIEKAHGIGE